MLLHSVNIIVKSVSCKRYPGRYFALGYNNKIPKQSLYLILTLQQLPSSLISIVLSVASSFLVQLEATHR